MKQHAGAKMQARSVASRPSRRSSRWVWFAAIAVATSMLPGQASAWGNAGHKIVCEIAFQELGASARTRVKEWIRSDPDYKGFAEACT